ncbi:MAG: Hint domain-containing protein [Deltaproteobacteria bacterium]
MPDQIYSTPILLDGSMVASLGGQPTNQGNPGDANFGIVMPGATALGTADDTYRLVWFQNVNATDVEFGNGQFWRLEVYNAANDPDGDPATGNQGWSSVPGYDQLTPKHDLVNGLGDGDEYIVFSGSAGHLLYNINGGLPATPTALVYLATGENGDPALGDNDKHLDFYDAYTADNPPPICFCAGTWIETIDGAVKVEDLSVGDLVNTRDSGFQVLRWIGNRVMTTRELAANADLLPIRIAARALGPDMPNADLYVSPQHRILVRSVIAQRMFDAREVLVAAKHLTGLPGIAVAAVSADVGYFHIAFDAHEIVFANGAEAESLHLRAEAMKAMSRAARAELQAVFPDLMLQTRTGARPFVAGRKGRKLAERHAKNSLSLTGATAGSA